MSTLTKAQQDKIRAWLGEHPVLSVGVGTQEEPCSVAAINLALTGKLTDVVPECMSEVIGQWIIAVQDGMPADIRNSNAWRDLLPLAAGTGREHEEERREVIYQWMVDALERLQHVADQGGYGPLWDVAIRVSRTSTSQQNRAAAWAEAAAWAAAQAAAWAAVWHAARSAETRAARSAAWHAAWAAAHGAARAAARATPWVTFQDAWDAFHAESDYPGLLARLIAVSEKHLGGQA